MSNTNETLYSATGLSYCISLKTVDIADNINLSWTNATNSTAGEPPHNSDTGRRTSVGQSVSTENVVNTDSGVREVLAGATVKYDLSGGQSPVVGISFDTKSNEDNVFTDRCVLQNGEIMDISERE